MCAPNHAASQPSFDQLGGLHQANAMSVITIAPLFLGSWVQPYKLPLSNLPSRLGTPTASVLPPPLSARRRQRDSLLWATSMPEAPPKVLQKIWHDPRTSKQGRHNIRRRPHWSTGKRGVVSELRVAWTICRPYLMQRGT